jgi:hypothetical protein
MLKTQQVTGLIGDIGDFARHRILQLTLVAGPAGAKAQVVNFDLYAALKRRSSHAFLPILARSLAPPRFRSPPAEAGGLPKSRRALGMTPFPAHIMPRRMEQERRSRQGCGSLRQAASQLRRIVWLAMCFSTSASMGT